MSGGIKDVWQEAGRAARKVGQSVSDAVNSEQAQEVGRTVGQLAEEIGDEGLRIARSKEVEAAVDGVGSLFKGLASSIHEARERAESPAKEPVND